MELVGGRLGVLSLEVYDYDLPRILRANEKGFIDLPKRGHGSQTNSGRIRFSKTVLSLHEDQNV